MEGGGRECEGLSGHGPFVEWSLYGNWVHRVPRFFRNREAVIIVLQRQGRGRGGGEGEGG